MELANKIFFAQVEEELARGHKVQLRMKGYSMRPLLRTDRDVVLLAPHTREQDLRVGQVVLFRYRGRHILHRIVSLQGGRVTLEGDGNYRLQEHCLPCDVVAIGEGVIRKSGRIVSFESRQWRLQSRMWLLLPPLVRRYTLGLLFRLGWK